MTCIRCLDMSSPKDDPSWKLYTTKCLKLKATTLSEPYWMRSMFWLDWQVFQPIPVSLLSFFLLESQWKLTWNCVPSLIHHTAGIFSQLTWRLHPRRVKEEWKPSAPVGCWSIHVKYRSDGRIIIGSSWWRVFRQRGVPFSPHLHIPTPFFLILCLLQVVNCNRLP